jgi:hypothetical protein
MAQEASTQAQTQTVKVVRPYRSTGMGGFDKTYVLTPSGQFIKPSHRVRSRSGNHGWDEWVLQEGRYAVVSISRPNLRNGAKPYTVNLQCIEVTNGELKVVVSKVMYVIDFDIENVREWALSICP